MANLGRGAARDMDTPEAQRDRLMLAQPPSPSHKSTCDPFQASFPLAE